MFLYPGLMLFFHFLLKLQAITRGPVVTVWSRIRGRGTLLHLYPEVILQHLGTDVDPAFVSTIECTQIIHQKEIPDQTGAEISHGLQTLPTRNVIKAKDAEMDRRRIGNGGNKRLVTCLTCSFTHFTQKWYDAGELKSIICRYIGIGARSSSNLSSDCKCINLVNLYAYCTEIQLLFYQLKSYGTLRYLSQVQRTCLYELLWIWSQCSVYRCALFYIDCHVLVSNLFLLGHSNVHLKYR